MSDWLQQALTIVLSVGLGSGGVGLYMARSQRRKTDADTDASTANAAQVVTATALTLLAPLEKKVADLTGEVDRLQTELRCVRQEYETYRALHPPRP